MLLLIAIFTANTWATDPVQVAIDQAQGLALKKNRVEAAQVLNKAIEAAAPPLRGRSKLIEVQLSIGKIFFTDKGQKLYESGQSLMFDTPDLALNHYKEALALEDGNILLLDSMARVQIAKLDCAGAATTLLRARELFPYAPEPAVLELRALICQKNYEVFREKAKLLPSLEKGQEAYVQYLLAQDFLQQKMWRRATDILTKVNEDEPQFPEAYYSLSRASQELGHDEDPAAEKYVALCKGIGLRERKRFALEPRLCANAKEVEAELLKKTTDL